MPRRIGIAPCLIRIALVVAPFACGHAEITETTLTIGEQETVVREIRRLPVQPGVQDLWLTDIPEQADLSTMILRTRRLPVEMLEWERVSTVPRDSVTGDNPGGWVVDRNGRIRARGERATLSQNRRAGTVRCRIRMPVGGTHAFELIYRVEGLSWSAHYQVMMRTAVEAPSERVSLDLLGTARVNNQTDRLFGDAWIRLIGGDPRVPREPRHRPGFLQLSTSPLADLWRGLSVEPPPQFAYRMPRRVSLRPNTGTDVPFVRAERIPASRLYLMDSATVPFSATGRLYPLRQYLVFNNTDANDLGWTLPPGPVDVYQGSRRRRLNQQGFLPHTAINDEIRVDLGVASDVSGWRRSKGRAHVRQPGYYDEVFEIYIENKRNSPITAEIVERPATSLTWDIQRVSEEYEQRGSYIELHPSIAANRAHRIEMRLRFHQPGN